MHLEFNWDEVVVNGHAVPIDIIITVCTCIQSVHVCSPLLHMRDPHLHVQCLFELDVATSEPHPLFSHSQDRGPIYYGTWYRQRERRGHRLTH